MDEQFCLNCKKVTVTEFDYACCDTICTKCGLVLKSDFINDSDKWSIFSEDDHRDQNLEACKEIERITDALQLNNITNDRACEIFSKIEGKRLRRRKKFNALCAACVSIACREFQISRTLKEISKVASGVELKELNKASLELKHLLSSDQTMAASPQVIVNARELVPRLCSNLDLSHKEIQAIQEAVEEAEKYDIRRNPKSVIAAIIFMISQLSHTKKIPILDIEIAAEVSENTIKNSVKELYPYASKIIPKWYASDHDIIKMAGGI